MPGRPGNTIAMTAERHLSLANSVVFCHLNTDRTVILSYPVRDETRTTVQRQCGWFCTIGKFATIAVRSLLRVDQPGASNGCAIREQRKGIVLAKPGRGSDLPKRCPATSDWKRVNTLPVRFAGAGMPVAKA